MLRALLAVTLILSASPMAAQDDVTPESYGLWISKKMGEIRRQYKDGNKEEALQAAFALNEEVDPYRDFMEDMHAYWWPDLMIARLGIAMKKYELVIKYAAPAVVAMDQDRHIGNNTRVELLMHLARALFRLKRYDEAEPVLRTLKVEIGYENAQAKPLWHTRLVYLMAVTATVNKADDARALRKQALEGYLEREGATEWRYLDIWQSDLRQRYGNRPVDRALLEDARLVHDYLTSEYSGNAETHPLLLNILGRIFAMNKDYDRASVIMRGQVENLQFSKPMSREYFFAVQNLAALEIFMNDLETAQERILDALDLVIAVDRDEYGLAISGLESALSTIARKLDQPELEQLALQRAYIAARRQVPANHAKAKKIRAKLDTSKLDPASFPYTAELGVETIETIELTLDGSSVLEWFFAGRYVQLENALKRVAREKTYDDVVINANLAVYYTLVTEPKRALDYVHKAKETLPPDAPAGHRIVLDLIELEILTAHFAVKGEEIDALLAGMPDFTKDGKMVGALQALFTLRRALESGNRAKTTALLAEHDTLLAEHANATPWGMMVGLLQIEPRFSYGDEKRALEMFDSFVSSIRSAGRYPLTEILADVVRTGYQADVLRKEEEFQKLGMQLRVLELMVPPKQGGYLSARINYAAGLEWRGRFTEAADQIDKVIDTYRTIPGFLPQNVGQLQITRARYLWQAGQQDVAFTMIAQVYATARYSDWSIHTKAYVLNTHLNSLATQERYEDVVSVMEDTLVAQEFDTFDNASKVNVLLHLADALIALEKLPEAREAIDRAIAAVPWPGFLGGSLLSHALMKRSYWGYEAEERELSYQDVKRANELWFDRRDALIAASEGDVIYDASWDRWRVGEHVVSAWRLTETIKEAQ